jgi:nifR3 family TIM-barrel protein
MSKKVHNFWAEGKRPIKILAPMAGYTDSAFRQLCCEFGADVVVTELISADAIAHGKLKVEKSGSNIVVTSKNHSTAEMLSFNENERPIAVQLFGKFPEKFGLATKWVSENLKPDGIDINMGCPARKVVGSDHGAALLKNPELAVEIVKAFKANTNLHVSVKTRLGWEDDDEILEFGPKLFEAGADAIIVHGRTYKDKFSGTARWENIFKLKEIVGDKIVIGNGDVDSISNFKFQISKQIDGENINLDGFAIGRATFGKPWIFSKDSATKEELKKIVLRHANLVYKSKGEKGIIEFRKHLLAYLKGFPNAKKLREKAVRIETISQVENILMAI